MYYFIVNPNAGSGRGLTVWNDTKKYLNKKNIDYDVYFTAERGRRQTQGKGRSRRPAWDRSTWWRSEETAP